MKNTQQGIEAQDELSRIHDGLIRMAAEVETSATHAASADEVLTIPHDPDALQHLAERAVCDAVDIYQTYNARILEAVVVYCPSALTLGRPVKSLRDSDIRKHVHRTLGVFEDTPMGLLVKTRNCLSHSRGRDEDGKVLAALKSVPAPRRLGIAVVDGRVCISPRAAIEVCHAVQIQLSMMDQELAHRFGLPSSERSASGPRLLMRIVQKRSNMK